MTTTIWIALAVVALLGLAQWTRGPDQLQNLTYLDADEPIIIRSCCETMRFPSLGIEINPPDGWSYLSITDDLIATELTFVNETSGSIIRIYPAWNGDWPEESEVTQHHTPSASLQWIEMGRRTFRLEIDAFGTELQHDWTEFDHRNIGRLSRDEAEVTIVVTPNVIRSQSHDSVDRFCSAIKFTNAND